MALSFFRPGTGGYANSNDLQSVHLLSVGFNS